MSDNDSGIFENVVGFNPDFSKHLATKTNIIQWLLKRVQGKKQDENRGYAAELLVVLLQNQHENRAMFAKADGVETLLTVASVSTASESNPSQN
jgi:beta-catenin-like protein 1